MNKKELEERYLQNKEILRRMKIMLNKSETEEDYEYTSEVIREAIRKVIEEQKELELIINEQKKEASNPFDNINLSNINSTKKELDSDPFSDIDLDNNEDSIGEEVTEVLTSDKIVRNKFFDAKIVFDGIYRIFSNNEEIYSEPFIDSLAIENSKDKTINTNLNIVNILKKFDEQNGSDLCDRYLNNQIEIIYDLEKYKDTINNKELLKSIKDVAKREKENNKKVTIEEVDIFKRIKYAFLDRIDIIKNDINYSNSQDNYFKTLKKKKRKKNIKLINKDSDGSIKVIFDGIYKVIVNNEKKYYEPISDDLLDKNISEKCNINLNIVELLKNYDKLNNTNLCDDYYNNQIDIIYDLDSFDDSNLNRSLYRKIEKIAKREAKRNNSILLNRKEKLRKLKYSVSAVAAAALLTLGGLGLKNTNKKTCNTTSITSEYSKSDKTENNKTKASNRETKTNNTVAEPIIVAKNDVVSESSKEDIEEISDTKKEEMVITEEKEEPETFDVKVGDIVSLDNADLYYTSFDESPNGNTSEIGNYDYKVSLISVVYKGEVVDVICTDSVSLNELEKACKEKYNDDVKLSVNFDVVDENGEVISNYVGWVNSTDIKTKSKVLIK